MKWLITGGAGYIGSHVTKAMVEGGEEVVIFDNLSTGKTNRVDKIASIEIGDIRDSGKVEAVLRKHRVEGVIHLAAKKSVEESRRIPEEYESVNHQGTRILLKAAKEHGIDAFLFSSSAAVYGNPATGVVDEGSPTHPISPYGQSKLHAEEAVNEYLAAGMFNGTSLRYFNVAGAASRRLADTSKSNLIPMVLDSISRKQPPEIFGIQYATKDGTCVRDYVDVRDVAEAHLLASRVLQTGSLPQQINIGTGVGYSVKEIIAALLMETGSMMEPVVAPARRGDPSSLVANVDLAKKVLNFRAIRGLGEIVRTSVQYQSTD